MSENFKNSKFRILKVECNIIGIDNIQQPKESGITLKIEEKLSCRKPKNLSDEIIQLEIDTVITSEEVQDLKISLLSQAIFNFEEVPSNIDQILQDECYPVARAKVYGAIKTITETMGIPPIDLNRQSE